MEKYRKRPVVIEAYPMTDANKSALLEAFVPNYKTPLIIVSDESGHILYGEIRTREGLMRADYWDLIIKGVEGELYPCKPDIFAKTYEKVEG